MKPKPFLLRIAIAMLLLLPSLPTKASFWTASFDQVDLSLNGGNGYSSYNNLTGTLAWGESYIMMSYMSMYYATEDVDYLKRLVDHAENVIDQRDDNAGRVDYRGISGATWVATKYSKSNEPYAWIVHSGMLTYPMADFADLVLHTPALQSEISLSGYTFLNRANWLVDQVDMTIAAHDDQWDTAHDIYRARTTPTGFLNWIDGRILPHNQYAALGRTLVKMYSATGNPAYLSKSIDMGLYFEDRLTLEINDSYVWRYHDASRIEDISHGAIEVDYAHLCEQAGIVFNATDMTRFANTFKKNVYGNPLEFYDLVDGNNGPNTYKHVSGRWLSLSQYDRDIYHLTLDNYVSEALVPAGSITQRMLGFANLQRYQKILEPVSAYRGLGSASEIADIVGGDFDNDGVDEFVLVRNFDANFYMYEIGPAQTFAGVSNLTGFGSASDWAGLAAGDFDPSHPGDEFVAVRNFDARFYLFKLVGSTIVPYATYAGYGPASNWAGLTAGDFDNDGVDEFAAVRNFDGLLTILEYNGSSIVPKASYGGAPSNSNWADLAAGDFDHTHPGDEIVAVNNLGGDFFVYGLSGSTVSQLGSYTGAGSGSNWTSIAAGDFNGDGFDEWCAHRQFDGDFYFYYFKNGTVYGYGREYHPQNTLKGALGTGKVETDGQEYDNLLLARDYDADCFVFKADRLKIRYGKKDEWAESLSDQAEAVALSVYPNPSSGRFQVKWEASPASIQLLDLQGRVLQSWQSETGLLDVDASQFAKGVYWIRSLQDGVSTTRKIVLN